MMRYCTHTSFLILCSCCTHAVLIHTTLTPYSHTPLTTLHTLHTPYVYFAHTAPLVGFKRTRHRMLPGRTAEPKVLTAFSLHSQRTHTHSSHYTKVAAASAHHAEPHSDGNYCRTECGTSKLIVGTYTLLLYSYILYSYLLYYSTTVLISTVLLSTVLLYYCTHIYCTTLLLHSYLLYYSTVLILYYIHTILYLYSTAVLIGGCGGEAAGGICLQRICPGTINRLVTLHSHCLQRIYLLGYY
jgi:hypothetical protein